MNFLGGTAKALAAALLVGSLAGCGTASATVDADGASAPTAVAAASGPAGSYADEDRDAAWDASSATAVVFSGAAATVSGGGAQATGSAVTISQAGTYVCSGTSADGRIVIDAGADALVRVVLRGLSLTCTDSAPFYVKQADKVVLILEDGTENTLADTENYVFAEGQDEPSAAVFSKDDLSVTGGGALTVAGNYKNGIASKDNLVITGGVITVSAVNDALRGKDSVSVLDGSLTLTAGGDGIQANQDTDATKGWIALDGGVFTITAGNDGVQAETALTVTGGDYTVVAGGGSTAAPARAQAAPGGGKRPDGTAHGQAQNTDGAPPAMPPDGAAEGAEPPRGMESPPSMPEGDMEPLAQTDDGLTQTDTESGSYKGFRSGTALTILGGSFRIDARDDAVHTNGDAAVAGGDLTILTGDDGVHADGALTISDGKIIIESSYEGLEGASVTITGGDIRLAASDDGVNAAGGSDGAQASGGFGADRFAEKEQYDIRITGGFLLVDASGDGLDANGSLYIDGGTVLVNGPSSDGDGALDYDGDCVITGGTLIAVGGAGMAQTPGEDSTQAVLSITYQETQEAGTLVSLADGGQTLLSFAPAKAYRNVVVSAPSLKAGGTYALSSGGTASGEAAGGFVMGGAVTGGTQKAEITLESVVTRVSDDGTAAATGGFGGGRGGMPRDERRQWDGAEETP